MTDTANLHQEMLKITNSLAAHLEHQRLSGIKYFIKSEACSQPQSVAANKALMLKNLRDELGDCSRCKLNLKRKNIVFGEGCPDARLMFIGEAPGGDEDIQGRPFVGRAGGLLTKIIEAINLTRAEVYIANIIKCRPPQNRDPEDDEMQACSGFLYRQIEIINPEIICTLGRVAARVLLKTDKGITKLRGQFKMFGDIKVMPTYHPSYLLRNESKKKETWIDMQKIQAEYFSKS